MTIQSKPFPRRIGLAALMLGAAVLGNPPTANAQTPDRTTFDIVSRPIQKVPTTFKFQSRISQAKLPVGEAEFTQVHVQIVRGTTDVLCTETLNHVQVKDSVLNPEIGRSQTCQLDEIIAANNDLNFRICIESTENCMKPIALASVPYAIKATFSQQAQEAYQADVAAQCHYAHRVTADTGLLSLSNQNNFGAGYYDYATPLAGALTGLNMPTMPSGVTNAGGFVQWKPVNADAAMTICQQVEGPQGSTALEKLDVFNVQSNFSYFSNYVYVGTDSGARGEGYLEVDGDGLYHGNVNIVGIEGAQEGFLTARWHVTSASGNVISAQADVVANQNVRAELGNVVSESADVVAKVNVRAETGNVVSEAADVVAKVNVRAETGNVVSEAADVVARVNIRAETGNVVSEAAEVIAQTNVRTVTGDVRANANVRATNGNVISDSAQVIAQTDALAMTGNVEARAGDVVAISVTDGVGGTVRAVDGQFSRNVISTSGFVRAPTVNATTSFTGPLVDVNDGQFDTISVGVVEGQPNRGFWVTSEGAVQFGGVPQFGDRAFSVEGHTHLGSAITSEIGVARVPDLPAGKITSEQFHVDRIPGLDASKITGGELELARIPNVPWTKVSGKPYGLLGMMEVTISGTTCTSVNRHWHRPGAGYYMTCEAVSEPGGIPYVRFNLPEWVDHVHFSASSSYGVRVEEVPNETGRRLSTYFWFTNRAGTRVMPNMARVAVFGSYD